MRKTLIESRDLCLEPKKWSSLFWVNSEIANSILLKAMTPKILLLSAIIRVKVKPLPSYFSWMVLKESNSDLSINHFYFLLSILKFLFLCNLFDNYEILHIRLVKLYELSYFSHIKLTVLGKCFIRFV